jgi:hypothetical protein
LPADVITFCVATAPSGWPGGTARAAGPRCGRSSGRAMPGPPGDRHPGGGGGVSAPLCSAAEALPGYMRALQLGDRAPSASEEKYLSAWQEMGFEPEAVAIAYDKTVLRCHEFKWPYCNGILKKWHEADYIRPRRSGRRITRPAAGGNACCFRRRRDVEVCAAAAPRQGGDGPWR